MLDHVPIREGNDANMCILNKQLAFIIPIMSSNKCIRPTHDVKRCMLCTAFIRFSKTTKRTIQSIISVNLRILNRVVQIFRAINFQSMIV